MTKRRLKQLVIALARYAHALEQIHLGNPEATDAVCKAQRHMTGLYMWREECEMLMGNQWIEKRVRENE